MLKTSDRPSQSAAIPCFEEAAHPGFGIAFEKQNGTRRLLPYSFLSSVDFRNPTEMVFTFTAEAVSVRGERLEPLWSAVCKGQLVRIWESLAPNERQTTLVRELRFIDSTPDTALNIPPYPQDR